MSTEQKKRLFITGGTGFFGKSMLDARRRGLLPADEWVVLSREPGRFQEQFPEFRDVSGVSFIAGDVRDFIFPAGHFDGIVHAATPAVTTLPPGEMRSIILRGMERVLAFARQCGAEKLLFSSSGAVYGPQKEKFIPEDAELAPVTEYGIAKREAEEMLISSGLHGCIARCFAFTGPYLAKNIHFAIGNFIRDARENRPVVIQGDGTPFRSYLYSDDLVQWLFAVYERGAKNRPYNVGSDQALTIAELARAVSDALGSNSGIRILRTPEPGAAPSYYLPDISRIKAELGVRITVGLPEAIRRSAREGTI